MLAGGIWDRGGHDGPRRSSSTCLYAMTPHFALMRGIVHDEAVLGGDPRLEGTRIGVIHVFRRYEAGESPEVIAADYDVSVADVHNALAYAFDNPEEIRAIEEAAREAVERIRETRPVDPTETTERP